MRAHKSKLDKHLVNRDILFKKTHFIMLLVCLFQDPFFIEVYN